MKIIRKSQLHHEYALSFEDVQEPGSGFSFPCDKDGNVITGEMTPVGCKNLEACLNGEYAVVSKGVVDYSHIYLEHAQGRCSCGRIVDLSDFTNECQCGFMYNSSGQLLAPREQWDPAGEY